MVMQKGDLQKLCCQGKTKSQITNILIGETAHV